MVAVADGSERDAVPDRWTAAGADYGMWMDMALDPRFAAWAEPAGERATLLEYLRRYRLTMEMKCADLDAAQLASQSVPPSTMSLLGLIRHMAGLGADAACGDAVHAGRTDRAGARRAPPQTLEAAQPIGAEHFAFADEAHTGLRHVGRIARVLVNNPFWDFWWD